MTKTEIKKALYKEKPIATRVSIVSGFAWYETKIEAGKLGFKIPLSESIGFDETIPAQLLIRWLQEGIGITLKD